MSYNIDFGIPRYVRSKRRRRRRIKRHKKKYRMKKDFPTGFKLPVRATVYVPSTIRGTKYVGKKRFKARIGKVQKDLTKKFGGSTLSRGEGTYTFQHKKRGKRQIAHEKVGMLTLFTTPKKWQGNRKFMRKYLKKKRKEWGQESIGLEFEKPSSPHALYFIEKRKKK